MKDSSVMALAAVAVVGIAGYFWTQSQKQTQQVPMTPTFSPTTRVLDPRTGQWSQVPTTTLTHKTAWSGGGGGGGLNLQSVLTPLASQLPGALSSIFGSGGGSSGGGDSPISSALSLIFRSGGGDPFTAVLGGIGWRA